MDIIQIVLLILLLVWNFLAYLYYRSKFKSAEEIIKIQDDVLNSKNRIIELAEEINKRQADILNGKNYIIELKDERLNKQDEVISLLEDSIASLENSQKV